jgi:hypothetical protein
LGGVSNWRGLSQISAALQEEIFIAIPLYPSYSISISKVKQGGCTRKGYAVRFPMLRIDRYAKRTTQTVHLHGYNQRLGYCLLIA